jgi:response regulator RpfG family c-di-GMP phosphodiesterase
MSEFRFLIIEDDPETLEFNEWVLKTEFDCQVEVHPNHRKAVEIIDSDSGPWSCFIFDYKTDAGTLKELTDRVHEKHPHVPIVLIHTGPIETLKNFKKRPIDQSILKAYDAFQLISAVKRALQIDNEVENQNYVAIRFDSLNSLTHAPCDLFVCINDQKYTRVADQGTLISLIDPNKYEKKGAPSLFCRKNDWALLLPAALKSVTTRMQMEVYKTQPLLQIKLSASVQELIQITIRNFGWSDEVAALAEANVQMVRGLMQNEPRLKIFEKIFEDPNCEQALIHSILLNYILVASYKKCSQIQCEAELDALSLAAFLHDAFLEDHQIRNESQFVSAVILKIGANKSDRLVVEKHPQQIFDVIKNWPNAPRHLGAILLEHHEKPDGKGFPNKLKSIEISRLSYAFIIAHEITDLFFQSRDIAKVYNQILKQKGLFTQNPYTFFDCAQHMLERALKTTPHA